MRKNYQRNIDDMQLALLGIDGAGKSTVSKELKVRLEAKGYEVRIVPFHKWVFADKLRTLFGGLIDRERAGRNAPYSPSRRSFSSFIKPPVAFLDNLLFYWLNSPKRRDQIVIYDRFICATQIKFKALDYHVDWFKYLWWNIVPDYAFIFDVDVAESIKRQEYRNDPYLYTKQQLACERRMYKEYAKRHEFPIFDSISRNRTLNEVTESLERYLSTNSLDQVLESQMPTLRQGRSAPQK